MDFKKIKTVKITDYITLPDEITSVSKPKVDISKAIEEACKDQNISIRKLADKVGLKHPQIVRVTSGDHNYNIETLLKILNGLDLELKIVAKNRNTQSF